LIQRCISNCSAFASHNQALTAGKLADALKLRSTETRAMASKEMPNAPALPGYAKTMVPDAVEPVYASINVAGDRATIITVATKAIPKNAKLPPGGHAPSSMVHGEMTLTHIKQSDGWKLEDQLFGPDPAAVTPCKE
jgi:hypothetical protein